MALLAIGWMLMATAAANQPASTAPVALSPAVEVVLAHFNEDIAWAEAFKTDPANDHVAWTMYSKAPKDRQPTGSIPLPNVGREGHTYLHHIVRNWDQLADWTVFSQAGAPTWADYSDSMGRGNGHLAGTTTFSDYLAPRAESFFVMSNALDVDTFDHSIREDLIIHSDADSNEECPSDGANGWTDWFSMPWMAPSYEQLRRTNNELSLHSFIKEFLSPETQKAKVRCFAQGARFAVARQTIKARPLAYYQRLLDAMDDFPDPVHGYWLEIIWHGVFHPDSDGGCMCDLPELPTAPLQSYRQVLEQHIGQGSRWLGSGYPGSRWKGSGVDVPGSTFKGSGVHVVIPRTRSKHRASTATTISGLPISLLMIALTMAVAGIF